MTKVAIQDAVYRFRKLDSAIMEIYTIGSSQPYIVGNETLKLITVRSDNTIVLEDKDMFFYIDGGKVDAIYVIPK